MKIKLLLVGKTVADYLKEGMALYEGRLKHYVSFRIEEIPELKQASSLSREMVKEKEGELIAAHLKDSDHVILLDERGTRYTSINWAKHLERCMLTSPKDIVLVIGGSYGFAQRIYDRADEKLSLSDMTFSHQLVRLIFLEQLYRAFTIIKGEPYHHE